MNKLLILLAALLLAVLALPAQVELPFRDNIQIQGADQASKQKQVEFIDLQPLVMIDFVQARDSAGMRTPASTILTIESNLGVAYEDLGEWKTIYSETVFSPVGGYLRKIYTSTEYDLDKCIPLWWAYVIVDRLGKEHIETHIFNMVLYQGSRWIMNSTPRPEVWEEMYQTCQY